MKEYESENEEPISFTCHADGPEGPFEELFDIELD